MQEDPSPPTVTKSPWLMCRLSTKSSWRGQRPGQGIRGDAWLFSEDTCAPGHSGSLSPSPLPLSPDLCNASRRPWLCCPAASGLLSQAHSLAQLVGLGQRGGWNHPRRREDTPPIFQGQNFPPTLQPNPAPLPVTSFTGSQWASHHPSGTPNSLGGSVYVRAGLGTRQTWSLVPAPWLSS